MDKRSSLLHKFVNYGRKKFYNIGPRWILTNSVFVFRLCYRKRGFWVISSSNLFVCSKGSWKWQEMKIYIVFVLKNRGWLFIFNMLEGHANTLADWWYVKLPKTFDINMIQALFQKPITIIISVSLSNCSLVVSFLLLLSECKFLTLSFGECFPRIVSIMTQRNHL